MSQLFLAFDVGTSGVKAVIVDSEGTLRDSSYRGYALQTLPAGGVEQDLGAIIECSLDAAQELLGRATEESAEIAGISVTAQMFNVVAIDEAGEPLAPMISWLDQRSGASARDLASVIPVNEQFDRFTSIVSGKDMLPKILWLRDTQPELYAKAAWLLDCKEAVVMHLTGVAVTDHAGASAYRLFDHSSRDWDDELCVDVGVDVAKLPSVGTSTDVAGVLRKPIASKLGLLHDVPVYVGVGDVPASQLGSGAVQPGDLHVSLGTAIYFGLTMSEPAADPKRQLGVLAHADNELWILWLEIATGGAALAWAIRMLGLDTPGPVDYDHIESIVRESVDEMEGLLFAPWLSGERVPIFDDAVRASFVGLCLHHGPGHLLRAVMEGVAFQMRWALEYGLDYGQPLRKIRAVGGGTMGSEWAQIIADVLERPLEAVASSQDAGAIGAASCAIVGSGAQKDYQFLAERTTVARTYEPDTARVIAYRDRYEQYRKLYDALYPLYHPPVLQGNAL